MPEVIFTGPAGRLEGRYQPAKQHGAPIAIVLHPHPQFGGTMNNQIVYNLYYDFANAGFLGSALQFPGRRPEPGRFRSRPGRIVGRRRRARLGAGDEPRRARLLDRRRLVRRLDRHAAPHAPARRSKASSRSRAMANRYDFSFLAPCPSSGLFVHGSEDRVAPVKDVMSVIEKVKTQKGVKLEHAVVEGANHFFEAASTS